MNIYSMTGFGRSEQVTRFGSLIVEISSVNNRFLELSLRMPRHLTALEPRVRELINAAVSRGQININVMLEDSENAPARSAIDAKTAAAYTKQLRALQKSLKLAGDVSIHDLVVLPEIARSEKEQVDFDAVWKVVKSGIDKALTQLTAHRLKEGQAMAADMKKRLNHMSRTLEEIEKQSVEAVATYRQRLTERVIELLGSANRENLRIEEEIALLAERTDITEECTRLKSHIELYLDALKQEGPVGKRLNFILQEMNREANTIGSKCSEFAISSLAIELKEEAEKLRELVQNVE